MAADLSPYVSGTDGPWDVPRAAHLLRRAGFGAKPDEVQRAVTDGLEQSVDRLFEEADDEEIEYQARFDAIRGTLMNFSDARQLQSWWVYRMMTTRVPLREKLTLFWHGHFASSYQKVESTYLMHRQVESMRKLAWGNFRELVMVIARDPAMLVYLDGQTNTKEHPNENFARELMELFTCGIGNYTEKDVLESARAFTGWHRNGSEFQFNAEAHDDGRKTVLGRAGRFDGSDVVDLLMQHPATPKFVARKLLRFFASPDPSPEVVSAAAGVFDKTQFQVKWFLRELFLSKYFYSEECLRKRISSPVEFVVGTARTLGIRMPAAELNENIIGMGQELLAPPNVKGWDGEERWINSSTWPARVAFAERVSQLNSDDPFGPHMDLEPIVSLEIAEPRKIVDQLAEVLNTDAFPDALRKELAEFMVTTNEGRQVEQFRDSMEFRVDKTRAVLGMMLGLPEYQNC